MKLLRTVLALAVGLSISTTVTAQSVFEQGVSIKVIDQDFEASERCKFYCDQQIGLDSIEFWYNSELGGDEAAHSLNNTEYTRAAARFLTQTTYGPTAQAINELASSIEALGEMPALSLWLEAQMSDSLIHSKLASYVPIGGNRQVMKGWWPLSITSSDQLRQRVAFALNHIMTMSYSGSVKTGEQIAEYYDKLGEHAFGNFRDLLRDVTYDIGMSMYLGNIANKKTKLGYTPNENYARELMQLFSIGMEYLATDGSLSADSLGNTSTYNNEDVVNLAKALSGFVLNLDGAGPGFKDVHHDKTEKILFVGTDQEITLAAEQSAKDDVTQALEAIFQHPNVGPFISKRLIQSLITSNPSADYIEDVSSVFDDDGSGVRGNMEAVVKAIILNPEAREFSDDSARKLKEPALRMTNLIRSFTIIPHEYIIRGMTSQVQTPLEAPSVFGFFQPWDSPAGGIRDAELFAPEFTLATDDRLALLHNSFYNFILSQRDAPLHNRTSGYRNILLGLEAKLAESDPDALIDRYNLLLMGGSMSTAMKERIMSYVIGLPYRSDAPGYEKAHKALYLVMTSAQQSVQQ